MAETGSVLVSIEYEVDPETAVDFVEAPYDLERVRRRNGAQYWIVFRDTADPDRYVELFVTRSWLSHLREHEQVSMADREVQERVDAFHVGEGRPLVTHFVPPSE